MSSSRRDRMVASLSPGRRTRRVLTAGATVAVAALSSAAVAQAAPQPFHAGPHPAGVARAASHARNARVASVTPTGTGTLYVNGATGNDTGTCRLSKSPCKTINYALSQSQNGDTISVAKGTYNEQLDINQSVTIKGAASTGSNATIIEPQSLTTADNDTDGTDPQAVIVTAEPDNAVNLTNLQINGTAGAGSVSQNGCQDDYVGVYYRDATGTMTGDYVTGIQLTPQSDLGGCQDGLGIYVATDNAAQDSMNVSNDPTYVSPPSGFENSNVTMSKPAVDTYQKNGITCDDDGTTCSITTPTVTGDGPTDQIAQNGIQFWGDSSATVSGGTVKGNSYTNPDPADNGLAASTGILPINVGALSLTGTTLTANDESISALWWPPYGLGPVTQGTWTINKNKVSGSTNSSGGTVPNNEGLGDGIDLYGVGQDSGSTYVESNSVLTGAGYGINLSDSASTTVLSNTVRTNGVDGVFVGNDSTGNTVQSNTSNGNGDDGILADSSTSGNQFLSNTLSSNKHYNAEDQSTGGGSGTNDGTSNYWTGNVCKPAKDASPESLCTS